MKDVIASAFLVLGAFLQLLAAIGIYRMPRSILRLQASSKASSLGISFMLIAAAIYHWETSVTLKCLLAAFFVAITAPAVSHVLARLDLEDKE